MATTIQKSTSGAYFTVTPASNTTGIGNTYPANSLIFRQELSDANGTQRFSLVKVANGDYVIYNENPKNIINGDTSTAFIALSDLLTYIQTNFYK